MNDFYCDDKELKDILMQEGKHDIRIRFPLVCELAVKRYPGDICEIGAKAGGGTVLLAEIARKYSRKIVAVDPWELNVEDCYPGEYEEFIRVMNPYMDILEIIRKKSQDPEAIAVLKSKTFSFVVIDALHYGWAIEGDIKIFENMKEGIIAIDDVNSLWGDSMDGYLRGAEFIKKTVAHNPEHREGYLI